MCGVYSRMQVNPNLLINLSCCTVFSFLWLIPFAFWKSKLVISIFNDKDFILVLIKNYCSTCWFILRKFWYNKIRIDIERFRTVKSEFLEESISLIVSNRRVIFKLKDRIDVIIPSFLCMITESCLLLLLFLREINKEFSDNWFIDFKLSFIQWFSLHQFLTSFDLYKKFYFL